MRAVEVFTQNENTESLRKQKTMLVEELMDI